MMSYRGMNLRVVGVWLGQIRWQNHDDGWSARVLSYLLGELGAELRMVHKHGLAIQQWRVGCGDLGVEGAAH
jgi:hypothetical protein